MKTLLCFCFCFFTFAFCLNCGSNNPVTNNPGPGTSNSITLLYPSSDTAIPSQINDNVHFNWSFTGTPTKFIWQIDTCTYTEPTFNNQFGTYSFPVFNTQNFNPCDTIIEVNNYGFDAIRRAWRVKAIFGNDTIISPYRYLRKF